MAGPRRDFPPNLSFDWEEGIFRGLLSLWRRVAPEREVTDGATVSLADHRPALTTLAQLVAGEPVRLLPARDLGGVRGRDLLLPRTLLLSADTAVNRRMYVVRACVSAAMRRATHGAPMRFTGALAPLESLRRARVATRWLVATLPRFEELHREAVTLEQGLRPDPAVLRGRERVLEEARQAALRGEEPWECKRIAESLRAPARAGRRSAAVAIWGEWIPALDAPEPDAACDPPSPGHGADSEELAPDVEELRRVRLDEKEKQDAVLIHTFEKVETLDSYRGGARDTDGADELDAQLDALREVDLGDLVRGEDAAHAVLRADLQMGISVPDIAGEEPQERGIPYPEWDGRRRRYREDWCTVYPTTLRETDPLWASEACARQRRSIRDLRRRLEVHRSGLRPLGRQLDGEDVDLAALVDAHAAARAGRADDLRLYLRQEKQRRDYATCVLLDASLSTDSWVENRRVLDVAREAVLVLGEVADQLGDRLQVLAFASQTRNRCRVIEVKGWRDPWPLARARLGALEPQGYTRIGPAVRHATDRLAAEKADRRLLLLVSDGKPTDYDRYEGAYGVSDVRQALREAERREICAHALAVDAVARDYLPAMFGAGAWHVLPHPGHLPSVLTTVYGRLTAR
jgi:nitric oxide reductase NorD protein